MVTVISVLPSEIVIEPLQYEKRTLNSTSCVYHPTPCSAVTYEEGGVMIQDSKDT